MAFLIGLILLFPTLVWACPSCAASNNGQYFNQKMIMMGVLWLLPVMMAVGIGLMIYRMSKKESTSCNS